MKLEPLSAFCPLTAMKYKMIPLGRFTYFFFFFILMKVCPLQNFTFAASIALFYCSLKLIWQSHPVFCLDVLAILKMPFFSCEKTAMISF